MGLRRKAREYALQALYLVDMTKLEAPKAFKAVTVLHASNKDMMYFSEHLFKNTLEHIAEIDEKLRVIAANWEMKRMAALDRNILRLAAYELLYELETPTSVIINEAIDMAKEFSTDDSGKFVNGILDKLKNERKAAADAAPKDITPTSPS